jgi:hypothetical protein
LLPQLPHPSREEAMALRDKMAASAGPYMRPGEIPVGSEYLRVHRRFFKDIESSDATAASTV